METIELISSRPFSGEVNEYGEIVLNFQDIDGIYTQDESLERQVLIKKMTVVANDMNLPQNKGYIQKKENLPDGYTFGEITLSKENLDELVNTPNPVESLYEMNPDVVREPLLNYYNEYLKEDDFEDIYDFNEEDDLERLARTYGRNSDEFIDVESKKDLMDDAKSEEEKTVAITTAINDEDLNNQVLIQLINNEDVYIGDDIIIESPWEEDEEEIGVVTEIGLDFIAKTYSFDLIKEEDGSWGIEDTSTPGHAVSPSNEEVKNIEIIGMEEQFEDGFGYDYEEDFSFEESKEKLFQKISKNSKLKEDSISDEKDEAWGEGYRAVKADEYKSTRTPNPYKPGSDLYRYWQNGYKAGEEDLQGGWYNESKKYIFEKTYVTCKESKGSYTESLSKYKEDEDNDIIDRNDTFDKDNLKKAIQAGRDYASSTIQTDKDILSDDNLQYGFIIHWEGDNDSEYRAAWERGYKDFVKEWSQKHGSKFQEFDENWFEEVYERERDGEYETPVDCCRCGSDCHDGGEIVTNKCHICTEQERNI